MRFPSKPHNLPPKTATRSQKDGGRFVPHENKIYVYATYTTLWHENIFRGPWNSIYQIYIKYFLANISYFYKENTCKIYFYYTLCENIFHIF